MIREVVGPVQGRVLDRVADSPALCVMPADFLERRACKRLEARGILALRLGFPDVWQATVYANLVDRWVVNRSLGGERLELLVVTA